MVFVKLGAFGGGGLVSLGRGEDGTMSMIDDEDFGWGVPPRAGLRSEWWRRDSVSVTLSTPFGCYATHLFWKPLNPGSLSEDGATQGSDD